MQPHSPDYGNYPPAEQGHSQPARRANLRFVDPDTFSNNVLHWLAQNPQANGKVALRVFPCRVLGTKQRPRRTADRTKLLLALSWYPQVETDTESDSDGAEWRVDEFLLASEDAQAALDFGEPYAVSAYSPGPGPTEIARCYVELQSEEPDQRRSGGRAVAGVEDSIEAQFSALIRQKVMNNMSEELGLAPARRRPTTGGAVPENLVPIGEGQFIDPRRAHTVWQAERDEMRRKLEDMERRQKEESERRGFLNHPLVHQAVSGVLPLLTAFAGAKMMGGGTGGPSQTEVFRQLLTVGQPPPADMDDDEDEDDEDEVPHHHWPRSATVAGPPQYSAPHSPPPASAYVPPRPVAPAAGSPPPAYHSPLAEDVPVVPTAGGADLHSVFGNDAGGAPRTVSGFAPRAAKVMPLEVRLKPVAAAVLKTIEAVQARVSPFSQWAAFRAEVEKEALAVFLPTARKAGIGDAELRLLAEKPDELTRQFMAAISTEDRARLGGIILQYVQQIIREIVTGLDWDAYLATA